ncbi:MAG: hypothetical protein JOZ56_00130 [Actinobacteria bacterium]|nr:hypothetical protein [Actinomycetota bacterium]MBV8561473.1 hypothetical protein [Actinomycetota bacterium]
MIFRRPSRFGDLIDRQLDVFSHDEAVLLSDCREREQAYGRAPREDAEEAYGDYVDAVDAAVDALEAMRDTFARTLDEDTAEAYEAEFNRAARRRWPALGEELAER